jgi:hypothetical protein
MLIFPKVTRFCSILFSIVEITISNNYVFEDDLIPHSHQGKGCKLLIFNAWEDISMDKFFGGKEIFREGRAGFPCIKKMIRN